MAWTVIPLPVQKRALAFSRSLGFGPVGSLPRSFIVESWNLLSNSLTTWNIRNLTDPPTGVLNFSFAGNSQYFVIPFLGGFGIIIPPPLSSPPATGFNLAGNSQYIPVIGA